MLQIKPTLFTILQTEILSDFTVVIRCRYFLFWNYSTHYTGTVYTYRHAFVTWKKVVIYFQLFFFSISVGLLLWNKTGQTEKWWIIQRRKKKALKSLERSVSDNSGISSFLSFGSCDLFPGKRQNIMCLPIARWELQKYDLMKKNTVKIFRLILSC